MFRSDVLRISACLGSSFSLNVLAPLLEHFQKDVAVCINWRFGDVLSLRFLLHLKNGLKEPLNLGKNGLNPLFMAFRRVPR